LGSVIYLFLLSIGFFSDFGNNLGYLKYFYLSFFVKFRFFKRKFFN
jgi:hypothetical protein